MGMTHLYEDTEPTMEAVQAWKEPTMLEFGVSWCPHCQAAQSLMACMTCHCFSGYEYVLVNAHPPGWP